MIEKISSIFKPANNYTSFKGRRSTRIPDVFEKDVDRSLVMQDLTAIGLLTLGVISYVKYKRKVDLQNINKIKYLNQAIANQSVYSTTARDMNVLNNYSRHIADKKAAVLKYKLTNGMFMEKSPEAMKHIKSNLRQMQLQSI